MKPDFPGALCACLVYFSGPVQAVETDAGLPVLADGLAGYYAVPGLVSPVAGHAPALSLEPRPSPPALMADLGVPIDLGTLGTAESDGCWKSAPTEPRIGQFTLDESVSCSAFQEPLPEHQ